MQPTYAELLAARDAAMAANQRSVTWTQPLGSLETQAAWRSACEALKAHPDHAAAQDVLPDLAELFGEPAADLAAA